MVHFQFHEFQVLVMEISYFVQLGAQCLTWASPWHKFHLLIYTSSVSLAYVGIKHHMKYQSLRWLETKTKQKAVNVFHTWPDAVDSRRNGLHQKISEKVTMIQSFNISTAPSSSETRCNLLVNRQQVDNLACFIADYIRETEEWKTCMFAIYLVY